jgi:hypothetical protein
MVLDFYRRTLTKIINGADVTNAGVARASRMHLTAQVLAREWFEAGQYQEDRLDRNLNNVTPKKTEPIAVSASKSGHPGQGVALDARGIASTDAASASSSMGHLSKTCDQEYATTLLGDSEILSIKHSPTFHLPFADAGVWKSAQWVL